MAAAGVAPKATKRLGKLATMPVLTIPEAVNMNARISMRRSATTGEFCLEAGAVGSSTRGVRTGGGARNAQAFNGSATLRCRTAQLMQAPRQPN